MNHQKSFLFAVLFTAASFGAAFADTQGDLRLGFKPNIFDNSAVDKTEVEGWINHIDVRNGEFVIIDPRGFNHRVAVKPGVIGDYKIDDHVRVKMRWDERAAETVEKLA